MDLTEVEGIFVQGAQTKGRPVSRQKLMPCDSALSRVVHHRYVLPWILSADIGSKAHPDLCRASRSKCSWELSSAKLSQCQALCFLLSKCGSGKGLGSKVPSIRLLPARMVHTLVEGVSSRGSGPATQKYMKCNARCQVKKQKCLLKT